MIYEASLHGYRWVSPGGFKVESQREGEVEDSFNYVTNDALWFLIFHVHFHNACCTLTSTEYFLFRRGVHECE